MVDLEIENLNEQKDIITKQLILRPKSNKLLDEEAAINVKLLNAEASRWSGTKRIEAQRTALLQQGIEARNKLTQDEIEKQKKFWVDYEKWYVDQLQKLPTTTELERQTALETVQIATDVREYLENLDEEYFKGKEKKIKEQKEWWDDYADWFMDNVDKLETANDKKQLAVIELMGKMTDLRAQRVGGIRRLERQITGEQERQNELQVEALNRIKELGIKLGDAFVRDAEVQAEKDKKIAEDRTKYIYDQGVIAEKENQAFIDNYLKEDQNKKDVQFKNEVDLQRKVAKSQKDAAQDKWNQMLADEEKQKAFDEYKLEQRKQSIEELGSLTIDYINIISSLSEKEVENAQKNRELLDTRISEASDALQTEIELYKAGYASNVAAKQKEIEDLKVLRDKALKEEEEARRKAHKLYVASIVAQKAVDIASIISQTGVANAKAVAVSPLTFGQPWVALNTVRAALSIAAAVAAVAAAQSAKFAKGGWTGDGRQKDETGERVAGIVHEREFVVRKGPAYKFREVLEAINRDDRKMIFNSFNKIDPNLLKGEVVNNVIVQNEGPNKRLDKIYSQLEKQSKGYKESVFEIQGARIIHRGNNTKIIKR